MIILSRGSLTKTGRFDPETMALNLSERASTATITMKIDAVNLAVGDWLQDDTDPGEGIVWRVKTIDRQYNTDTETVQLEHIIETLNDNILNGEIKPSDIAGSGATTCTAKQAIDYILNRQSHWVLYDFDYSSVSNPYNFNNDSLKEGIETVSSSLADAVWSFDFSVYPFRLNIKQLSSTIASEMRMSRNISTMKVTVDRSRMYTRFYPIGKNNLRLTAPGYVGRNESTWGVIEKTDTDQSKTTQAELTAWANERLDRHAEPLVTVTISGLDLSEATGEALDHLTIGTTCRVPLPEYGATITEKVTKLSWKDKLSEPENVTVTLANQAEDIASIVNNLSKSSQKRAKNHAKNGEADHAWMVDTNDHIGLIAEGVAGAGAATDWSLVASLLVDGNGIHQRVQEARGQIVTAFSAIEQTKTQIYITVADAKSDLYSYIDVTASGIAIAAAAAQSSVYSVIEVTATSIRSEVSRRAKVFIQLNDPALDLNIRPTLSDGDIWIRATGVQSWSEMNSTTWSNASEIEWNRFSGAQQNVWDSVRERWEPVSDRGLVTEWGTRIDQTERNISLIARAIGAIDPSAIAEIDVSADAISLAVSTAKSELYSLVLQTATNISSQVSNNITGISSYIDQTASSISQAVALKNKVYIQMTDPAAAGSGNTVVDGDIWIKSVANDTLRPSWTELSAKTWTSQSSTNWRDYYSSAWYARKNGVWELMREDADVVEIGTKLEQDENHIALIARTVDENHQELGARLTVTAQEIRGEVHAAKSTLYSVISQTATNVFSGVYDTVSDNFSTIEQTASSITTQVNAAKSTLYTTVMQTATNVFSGVYNKVSDNFSTIEQTSSSITASVNAAKSTMYSQIQQTASSIRAEVASSVSSLQSSINLQANRISLVVSGTGSGATIKAASIVTAINNGSSSIQIDADHISIGTNKTLGSIIGVNSQVGYAYFIGQVGFFNSSQSASSLVTINNGTVDAPTLSVANEGTLKFNASGGSHYDMDFATVGSMIKTATVANNTLTIERFDGTTDSFSRATTLSGAWSGRNFTVTASPQGNTKMGTVYGTIVPTGSITRSNKTVKRTFIVYSEDLDTGDAGQQLFSQELSIDASSVWDASRNAETQVTMTRGAYNEQSRTYTCTCTVSGTIAKAATFYLYAH